MGINFQFIRESKFLKHNEQKKNVHTKNNFITYFYFGILLN